MTGPGPRLTVRVTPRASSNSVELDDAGVIRVRVTAAPADGAANRAVLAVLAEALGLGVGRLQIVSGATARQKGVQVSGISVAELTAKVREFGAQPSVASRRRTAGRMPPAR